MTSSKPKQPCWMDGRLCPDCAIADAKNIELQMCGTETDKAGIVWEKWQCPNCLYVDWDEVGEAGADVSSNTPL